MGEGTNSPVKGAGMLVFSFRGCWVSLGVFRTESQYIFAIGVHVAFVREELNKNAVILYVGLQNYVLTIPLLDTLFVCLVYNGIF